MWFFKPTSATSQLRRNSTNSIKPTICHPNVLFIAQAVNGGHHLPLGEIPDVQKKFSLEQGVKEVFTSRAAFSLQIKK